MKKRNFFFGTFLGLSLVIAGASAFLLKPNNETFEVKADAIPNNMFGYIYNDSFNNQDNHLTLFVFEGTATGLSENYNFSDISKIKLNGVGLDTLNGTAGMWSGKNWMQVTYPTTSVYEGATLEIESGLVAGDAVFSGCKFVMNSNSKWVFNGFNDPVTATYHSIPHASFNTNNQLLIQYNGSGKLGGDKVTNAKDICNYDNYATINGTPFSSISGAELRTWSSEQPWLWLRFPEASNGDVLRIERGMRFYSEVFETMTFVFNGTSWDKKSFVSDDSDVANSDYKIFTINDYPFAVNDAGGFIFYSNSNYVDAMNDSFCFRVNVNKTNLSTNMAMKFAGTDIFGNGAIIAVTINFSSNAYLTFNGNIDWSTNLSPTWEAGVNYLVEVYVIHTSSTSCVVILARDGEIIWKSAIQDTTGLVFNNNFTTSGTANTASEYTSPASTISVALNRFGERKLSTSTVAFDDNRDTGACLTAYAGAKSFYQNYLTNNQKAALATEVEYVNLKNRLVAWAAANGETFDPSTKTFTSLVNIVPFAISDSTNDYSYIVAIFIAMVLASSLGLFFLQRRKREN